MWARRMAGPVAVALMVLSACGEDSGGTVGAPEGEGTAEESPAPTFSQDQADTQAAYTLADYRFEGPTVVKGPKLYFTAENEGTEDHELEVLDASGEAVGEIEAFAPGADAPPLALELEPGTYTIQCILTTAGGQEHKALGMVSKLTVE